MVFEQYQFLRYFIPGSLYVVYTSLIILANLSPYIIQYLKGNPDSLIGVVVGAFGASLVFGYLIYSTYDWLLYNKLALRKGRKSLAFIGEIIETEEKKRIWESSSNEKKKEFLDFLYYWKGDGNLNLQMSDVIRGIWSHFNARIVSSIFVPVFSGITIISLYLCVGDYLFLFSSNWSNYIVGMLIVAMSIGLLLGARRPFKETTMLEFLFLKHKIHANESDFQNLPSELLDETNE